MKLIILSVIINGCLTLHYFKEVDSFCVIAVSLWTLSLNGSVLYMITEKKKFGIMAMIGFIGFVPMGLIAVFRIKKMMYEKSRNEIVDISPAIFYKNTLLSKSIKYKFGYNSAFRFNKS